MDSVSFSDGTLTINGTDKVCSDAAEAKGFLTGLEIDQETLETLEAQIDEHFGGGEDCEMEHVGTFVVAFGPFVIGTLDVFGLRKEGAEEGEDEKKE